MWCSPRYRDLNWEGNFIPSLFSTGSPRAHPAVGAGTPAVYLGAGERDGEEESWRQAVRYQTATNPGDNCRLSPTGPATKSYRLPLAPSVWGKETHNICLWASGPHESKCAPWGAHFPQFWAAHAWVPSAECQPGLPVPGAERSLWAKQEVWELGPYQGHFPCTCRRLGPEVGLESEERPQEGSDTSPFSEPLNVPHQICLSESFYHGTSKRQHLLVTPCYPQKKGHTLQYGSQGSPHYFYILLSCEL